MMKTRVKNAMKAVRLAIESNDTDATTKAADRRSILDKAASKKVIHWRTAAMKDFPVEHRRERNLAITHLVQSRRPVMMLHDGPFVIPGPRGVQN